MCAIVHRNRQKTFQGVSKSPVVNYNDQKQRIRYLCIGCPPSGENSVNTAANTHRVLNIVKKAMQETGNHGDGGWKSALSVSICFEHFFTMALHLSPTLHTHTVYSVKTSWLAGIPSAFGPAHSAKYQVTRCGFCCWSWRMRRCTLGSRPGLRNQHQRSGR